MKIKEFFLGTTGEQAVLNEGKRLQNESHLTTKEKRRLDSLDPQVKAISRRLGLRKLGAGVVTTLGLGVPLVVTVANLVNSPGPDISKGVEKAPDLGLNIDEAGFWRVVAQGPRFGVITHANSFDQLDYLRTLGNLYIGEVSPNFAIGINQPMADFIFTQADLVNSVLPTRIIFSEEWFEGAEVDQYSGGFAAITTDGMWQDIRISINAAALETFLHLDQSGKVLELDNFRGVLSHNLSYRVVHEAAHGGREARRFLSQMLNLTYGPIAELVHPQIFTFTDRYNRLFNEASLRGQGDGALVFAVDTSQQFNLEAYKISIYRQARARGIIK